MVGAVQVLTVEEIVEVNRRMIAEFGGIFFVGDKNLANPGSLEHVLEEIQGSLFGHVAYPSLIEKAAAIAWRIITRHVFHDGNKRTGMEVCRLFLEMNGYTMRIDMDVVTTALRIAKNEVGFEAYVGWLNSRCAPTPPANPPQLQ
jgi:death-on-curing protein